MAGLENLSERDRAVLRSIFDPTATIGDVADDCDTFVDDDQGKFIQRVNKKKSKYCIIFTFY